MENEIKTSSPDIEVVTSRDVNASQETVFRAWTEPEHLKNWWGPKGFTNTFQTFDLRPHGKWSFIMHGPDGKSYPNESVFIKIVSPELLIFNHVSDPKFQVVAIFDEISEDKTRVTFKMVFDTAEQCNNLRAFVTGKNEENFDRLEDELRKMTWGK